MYKDLLSFKIGAKIRQASALFPARFTVYYYSWFDQNGHNSSLECPFWMIHISLERLLDALRNDQKDEDDGIDECDDVSNYDDVDDYLLEPRCKNDSVPNNASPYFGPLQKCGSAEKGEHSSGDVSLNPATSSSEPSKDATSKDLNFPDENTSASEKQVLMRYLLYGICKHLLCRPVVLYCGHVYCENCMINPSDKLCRCPVYQLEHPNGYPNICLILAHYLEEQFPELYASREKASAYRAACQIPSAQN
ncbi:hypothetical protein FXO38_12420 [Capsicum annuum]|nr:hypothetical protein FXO38_12420 [Capsicum annuum]KAF3666846.1 hypothetical protein FXO37_10342 [Capsicum annuum]